MSGQVRCGVCAGVLSYGEDVVAMRLDGAVRECHRVCLERPDANVGGISVGTRIARVLEVAHEVESTDTPARIDAAMASNGSTAPTPAQEGERP